MDAAAHAKSPEAHFDVHADLYLIGNHVRHTEESPTAALEVWRLK